MSKPKMLIVGGCADRLMPNSKIFKCKECGAKTQISGQNIERANRGIEVLCPKCGVKQLQNIKKGEIKFPSQKEMLQLMTHDSEVARLILLNMISTTIRCKTCGTEIGHVLKNGGVVMNKTKINEIDPKDSKELARIGKEKEDIIEKMVT